jgi:hypothetical protein
VQKDKRTPIHDLSVEFDAVRRPFSPSASLLRVAQSLRPQRHTNPQSNAFDSNRIVVYALLSDGAAAGQVTLKGKHPEGTSPLSTVTFTARIFFFLFVDMCAPR